MNEIAEQFADKVKLIEIDCQESRYAPKPFLTFSPIIKTENITFEDVY